MPWFRIRTTTKTTSNVVFNSQRNAVLSSGFVHLIETTSMHHLLFYDVVENYTELRKPHRAEHFAYAMRSYDRGELALAGALADPVDGAVFVFRGSAPEIAEEFARNDPYVLNGLVTSWRVREWTTVLGDGATLPSL